MPRTSSLSVCLSLKRGCIRIQFRSIEQAEAYIAKIEDVRIDKGVDLNSHANGRWVSLNLPDVVTDIYASSKVDGFYLTFKDDYMASRWKKKLGPIWNFVDDDSSKVYVVRDVDDGRLNSWLGISTGGKHSTGAEPGPAKGTSTHGKY